MFILNRSMQGALNGNIGMMKSIMGEVRDSTDVAHWQAFSSSSLLLGQSGLLSGEHVRLPSLGPCTAFAEIFSSLSVDWRGV